MRHDSFACPGAQCRTVLQHGLRQQPVWQLGFNHAAWQPDATGAGPLLLAARCLAWVIVLRLSRTASGCGLGWANAG